MCLYSQVSLLQHEITLHVSLFTSVIVTTPYMCLYSQVSLLQHEIT